MFPPLIFGFYVHPSFCPSPYPFINQSLYYSPCPPLYLLCHLSLRRSLLSLSLRPSLSNVTPSIFPSTLSSVRPSTYLYPSLSASHCHCQSLFPSLNVILASICPLINLLVCRISENPYRLCYLHGSLLAIRYDQTREKLFSAVGCSSFYLGEK